jgi:hypothetical protein
MVEPEVLIDLFARLKKELHLLNSKCVLMDAMGINHLEKVMEASNAMDRYIDSFKQTEECIIPVGLTYEQAYFNLTATPRKHYGPSIAMRKYAAAQEKKSLDKIDNVIQLGKELEKNKDKPYFP